MGRALEVIAVLRFGKPPFLGLALALKPARRLGTVGLVSKVASIRQKDTFAMQAFARVGRRRHRACQENPTPGASQHEMKSTNRETNPRRSRKKEEKICRTVRRRSNPRPRISNRQNHTDFIPPSASGLHGTRIVLSKLNPNLNLPQPDRFKQILARDYGRETDFVILVNGERVFAFDVPGTTFECEVVLPNGATAKATYTIADKPLPARHSGVVLRQGGKSIGKAHLFGLEGVDELSDRLRRRIVGEVNVPPDAIELTAAGGNVIESDKSFEHLSGELQKQFHESLTQTHTKEVNLAKGRWKQQMDRRLVSVPEHRRGIIEQRMNRLISRAYQEGEKEERIGTLVDLVLDALEHDEYWAVCNELHDTDRADVMHLADALLEFGLCDLAFMGRQAKSRLDFLKSLDRLAGGPDTLEKQMHKAIEKNLWVIGPQYTLMASNQQLGSIAAKCGESVGAHPTNKTRPDLLLSQDAFKNRLLVEFKRPKHTVDRDDEGQAKKYADWLKRELQMSVDIVVIGGTTAPSLCDEYSGKRTQFSSYAKLIADAQASLDWMIEQLRTRT